jgi:hypothetical protein
VVFACMCVDQLEMLNYKSELKWAEDMERLKEIEALKVRHATRIEVKYGATLGRHSSNEGALGGVCMLCLLMVAWWDRSKSRTCRSCTRTSGRP